MSQPVPFSVERPRHAEQLARPRWRWLAVWLLFSSVCAGCSSRSEFPAQPIVLVCPWSPGGGTDRVSRQIATQLERVIGVPVNVVNATGGGGVTGHTRGALARPDGYTLTTATVELNMLHWRGLTGLTYRDFQPLLLFNEDDAAIFVRADSPWRSIGDVEAAFRNQPGLFRASGSARGSIWHIALAGWLLEQNLSADAIIWVSINGSGPSLQELLAGGVDLICCSIPEARSLLEGGEIRCLGVMAETRHPQAPDVPTFREAGSNWTMGGWRGLVIPRGVPKDRVTVIRDALVEVVHSDEFAEFMTHAGFNLTIGMPAEFAALLADADERFGQIFATAAIDEVSQSPVGPYAFPLVLFGVGSMIGLWLAARGQLGLQPDAVRLSPWAMKRLAVVPLAGLIFMLTAERVGFLLAAMTLLLGLLLAASVRLRTAAALTLVLVPLVYHIFAVQLGVPLPRGWLGW
ncbi:MAG: tripartite tricarboxylate transporter substrate-binding protein [Planctomycetota bacterium]|nr:tripartite tricarboxylate transporter substrate-binding protein [Planctomycetota bacterium]